MIQHILEDRIYNFIIKNPSLIINIPSQIYIKNIYKITLQDLLTYLEYNYYNNNIRLNTILLIQTYLWDNYIWNSYKK